MKVVLKVMVVALVVLAGVAVGGVALVWEPDRTVAELAPQWAPAPSQFVDVMGMQVHLRDEGVRDDPVPILLLHGTSASLHTWEGWVAALKSERRVITLDLPGFGLTGPFPDNDYRVSHYVTFLTAVLDKLGVQRVVVGGNSFGGRLAWALASAQPARVDKLILVDAGGYPDPDAVMPIGFRLAQVPALSGIIAKLLPRDVVDSSVRFAYGDPDKVSADLVDRYFELTLRAGNRVAVVERFRQAKPGEDHERIADLKQPTLILWGDRDRLITPAMAQRFQQDIAGSELVMFEGLGHVPHEEDPAATVARVKAFL
jgi:pimeloyl-ACP methyl ester carboxylesterase